MNEGETMLPELTLEMFPGTYPHPEHDLDVPHRIACVRIVETLSSMTFDEALAVLAFVRSLVLLQRAREYRPLDAEEEVSFTFLDRPNKFQQGDGGQVGRAE
jgi:hypothetical protein